MNITDKLNVRIKMVDNKNTSIVFILKGSCYFR